MVRGTWYVVRGDCGPRTMHHAPKYLPGSHLRCSRISWGMTKADTQVWLHHWQDEADAAYLYLALAGQESDPHRKDVYIKLAGVEERHVQIWSKLLGEQGHKVDHARPSLNAKLRAWFGRRFGTRFRWARQATWRRRVSRRCGSTKSRWRRKRFG